MSTINITDILTDSPANMIADSLNKKVKSDTDDITLDAGDITARNIVKFISAYAYASDKDSEQRREKRDATAAFKSMDNLIRNYDNLIANGNDPAINPAAFQKIFDKAEAVKSEMSEFMLNMYKESIDPYDYGTNTHKSGFTEIPTARTPDEVKIQNIPNENAYETMALMHKVAHALDSNDISEAMHAIADPKEALIAAHQKNRSDLADTMAEEYDDLMSR